MTDQTASSAVSQIEDTFATASDWARAFLAGLAGTAARAA